MALAKSASKFEFLINAERKGCPKVMETTNSNYKCRVLEKNRKRALKSHQLTWTRAEKRKYTNSKEYTVRVSLMGFSSSVMMGKKALNTSGTSVQFLIMSCTINCSILLPSLQKESLPVEISPLPLENPQLGS